MLVCDRGVVRLVKMQKTNIMFVNQKWVSMY